MCHHRRLLVPTVGTDAIVAGEQVGRNIEMLLEGELRVGRIAEQGERRHFGGWKSGARDKVGAHAIEGDRRGNDEARVRARAEAIRGEVNASDDKPFSVLRPCADLVASLQAANRQYGRVRRLMGLERA